MTAATIHPTSVIDPGATLGADVRVGPFAVVGAGVSVGDGTFVESHCVLGAPVAAFYDGGGHTPAATTIGTRSVIRSHCVIYEGVTAGDGFQTGHHVTIREGAHIGTGVRVGSYCDVQPEAELGDHTRLHSNVFVARGSRIEELTWLFPGVTLLDDPHPPSDECTTPPTIRRLAVVGARATIASGVEIGEGALVGAASLVRHDVAPETVVAGVPARELGRTADVRCGHGNLEQLYPWWLHFRRGYPDGVLPE
jgi:acyl-[acyl carrier protein]--UDP-N-acetylglucosamine O-acyltransferase